MLVSEIYKSKYTAAKDLPQTGVEAKIVGILVDQLNDRNGVPALKIVVSLDGHSKPFIVNTINARKIAETFGDDIDGWKGRVVKCTPIKMMVAGKMIDAIVMEPSK